MVSYLSTALVAFGRFEPLASTLNLWFATARALGFKLVSVWSKSRKFAEKMASFVGGASVLSPTVRHFNSFPSVVFTDEAALPPSVLTYWAHYLVPYIFFCQQSDADSARVRSSLPRAPFGWSVLSVDVPYNSVGGAIMVIWTLVAWYPPGQYLPLPTLPWSPLHCFLNDRYPEGGRYNM